MKDDAAQSKPTRATSASGTASQFGIWTNGHALEKWAQASASTISGAVEISQEVMRFSQNQLQAGMDAWKTAASCRNPTDVLELQKQLVEKSTAEYLDEARKLTSRMIGLFGEAAMSFREEGSTS
jgi:hypothetical protein